MEEDNLHPLSFAWKEALLSRALSACLVCEVKEVELGAEWGGFIFIS